MRLEMRILHHRAGAIVHKTPVEEMMAASVMFSMNGVDKTRFIEDVKADPHTYSDWFGPGWGMKTSGKEDELFSPYLKKPFEQAIKSGLIPEESNDYYRNMGSLK